MHCLPYSALPIPLPPHPFILLNQAVPVPWDALGTFLFTCPCFYPILRVVRSLSEKNSQIGRKWEKIYVLGWKRLRLYLIQWLPFQNWGNREEMSCTWDHTGSEKPGLESFSWLHAQGGSPAPRPSDLLGVDLLWVSRSLRWLSYGTRAGILLGICIAYKMIMFGMWNITLWFMKSVLTNWISF